MRERQGRAVGARNAARSKPESFGRLRVTVDDREHYALVTVAGEVDVTTGTQLREPLHELVEQRKHRHVVDLREVTFLDSTGLGILVSDHKRLRDRDGSLHVVVTTPGIVARVFRLTGVDRVVPLVTTIEDAEKALGLSAAGG
ncbi:STAS domain-containing protein [Cryptosporangium sp. NPDC048952]|uniref:STAS domain-containing protein n=1 Tax=Cryptosporangium sp. NPDC048952 TaxID=3363961 RepID=UPI00372459BF